MNLSDLINRLRGRPTKWQAPKGNGLEHDDWRVGDLAECVTRQHWFRHDDGQRVNGPRPGQLLRVVAVDMVDGWHCLSFEGLGEMWTAECFRKIWPRKREACTPAFACLIKSIDRKVEA